MTGTSKTGPCSQQCQLKNPGQIKQAQWSVPKTLKKSGERKSGGGLYETHPVQNTSEPSTQSNRSIGKYKTSPKFLQPAFAVVSTVMGNIGTGTIAIAVPSIDAILSESTAASCVPSSHVISDADPSALAHILYGMGLKIEDGYDDVELLTTHRCGYNRKDNFRMYDCSTASTCKVEMMVAIQETVPYQ